MDNPGQRLRKSLMGATGMLATELGIDMYWNTTPYISIGIATVGVTYTIWHGARFVAATWPRRAYVRAEDEA